MRRISGSRNGIRVDGVRCVASWVLPGVRLSIAEHQFELSYLGDGPEPIPDMVESGPRKSLMSKLGVSDRELDRAMSKEPLRDAEEPASRRWNLTEDA